MTSLQITGIGPAPLPLGRTRLGARPAAERVALRADRPRERDARGVTGPGAAIASKPRARLVVSTRQLGSLAPARLDRHLALLARRPARYERGVLELCAALDARGVELELPDPSTWRAPTAGARVRVEQQFSAEIGGLRTLGREEEVRLARRIEFARIRLEQALQRAGAVGAGVDPSSDESAPCPSTRRRRQEWQALRLEMVERSLWLVPATVERYRHTSAERSDLIQAAALSLFRAVDGFDWRRGVLFRTYAVHWLKQGCRSYLYNLSSLVRVPVYLQKSLKHVNAALQRLGDPHASDQELAEVTGLRASLITTARSTVRRTRTLDGPQGAELDGLHALDSKLARQADEGPYSVALEAQAMESGVQAALERLTQRERRVVELRFGITCGRVHILSEVAAELGVSLERVRQILIRALAKMRTSHLREVLELRST